MSTHNICFCQEISKILCGYPLLSVAILIYLEIWPYTYDIGSYLRNFYSFQGNDLKLAA